MGSAAVSSGARVRWRRTGALLVAIVAIALAASSTARAAAWYDGGAGKLPNITFNAVAQYGGGAVVVAVGHDSSTHKAVIYRRSGSAWSADAIGGSLPVNSQLVDVAIGDGTAWAVGDIGGSQSLLVSFAGGGPALAGGGGSWNVVSGGAGALRSVTNAGASAFAGSSNGHIYQIAGSPAADIITRPEAAVNGVAATSDAGGFAVGYGGATDARIFSFSTSPPLASPAMVSLNPPDTSGQSLLSVATSGGTTLAIDGNGYWQPGGNGAWSRSQLDTLKSSEFGLSHVAVGPGAAEAVAGQVAGIGAVWRGTGGSGWTRDDAVASKGLNGVAVTAANDIWAVGDGGTVRHFFDAPPPPPKSSKGGGGGTPQQQTPATVTYKLPKRKGQPTIYVVEPGIDRPKAPKGRKGHRPPAPKRMLKDVSVARVKGRLVVSFNLTANGSVIVSAKRAGRVVGQAAARSLRAGRHKLFVPISGKGAPTELRIVVGPAQSARKGR